MAWWKLHCEMISTVEWRILFVLPIFGWCELYNKASGVPYRVQSTMLYTQCSFLVLAYIFLLHSVTCALSEVVSKSPALLTMIIFSRMKAYCAVLNTWRYRAHLLPFVNKLFRISPYSAHFTVPAQFYVPRCAMSLFNSQRTKKIHLHNTIILMSWTVFIHHLFLNSLFPSVLSRQQHVSKKSSAERDFECPAYHTMHGSKHSALQPIS